MGSPENRLRFKKNIPFHKMASKPAIEKRRRARINHSVTKLAEMVMDPDVLNQNRPARLQKTHILETAVDFVKRLKQREYRSAERQYQNGYRLCMSEVQNYFLRNSKNKSSWEVSGRDLRSFLLDRMDSLFHERWVSKETQTEENDLPQSSIPSQTSSDLNDNAFPFQLDEERSDTIEQFKSGSLSSDSNGSSYLSSSAESSSGDEPQDAPDDEPMLYDDPQNEPDQDLQEFENQVLVWRPW